MINKVKLIRFLDTGELPDAMVFIGAPISIAGDDYICEVVVKKFRNRQGFYVHGVELKEKVGVALKTSTEGRATPISKLIIAKLFFGIQPHFEKRNPRMILHRDCL